MNMSEGFLIGSKCFKLYDNCASIFTYTSPSNEWLLSIHNYASFINDLHLWRIFESFYFVSIVILRMFLIPVFCFTYSSFRILFSPESFSNWFEQSSRKWNATFHVLRVYFSASALEMLSDFFSFLFFRFSFDFVIIVFFFVFFFSLPLFIWHSSVFPRSYLEPNKW